VRHAYGVFAVTFIALGSGPLEVSYTKLASGLEKPYVEAMKALGVHPVLEPASFFPHSAYRSN